jgi:hypothetical protein
LEEVVEPFFNSTKWLHQTTSASSWSCKLTVTWSFTSSQLVEHSGQAEPIMWEPARQSCREMVTLLSTTRLISQSGTLEQMETPEHFLFFKMMEIWSSIRQRQDLCGPLTQWLPANSTFQNLSIWSKSVETWEAFHLVLIYF